MKIRRRERSKNLKKSSFKNSISNLKSIKFSHSSETNSRLFIVLAWNSTIINLIRPKSQS